MALIFSNSDTWKHAKVHKKATVPTSDNFFRFNITSGLRLQYKRKGLCDFAEKANTVNP